CRLCRYWCSWPEMAVYMLSRKDTAISGQEHQYLHNLHHSSNEEYRRLFRENYKKYFSRLKESETAESIPEKNP
ncbi:MAG: hypothetical protein LUH36_09550, partial [Oscillospiraceae bacterium]|nr:hypothetical protein [Oscillospiraceae bacterium]